MDVSVVIPVYNAGRFLADSIASVLLQPEVHEVLLVDDGSNDNSLRVCQNYMEKYSEIITLFQHPDGSNHGVAETRNLGMRHARCDYIAFLDADDIYLPGRFTATVDLFEKFPDADGIYETVETRFIDGNHSDDIPTSAGPVLARIPVTDPGLLFRTLALPRKGYIHLNGLTLKRSSLSDQRYFDPTLRQSQDTDFVLRLAATTRLYGGDPDKVVAVRQVHDRNRVHHVQEALHYRYLCMRKCALHDFYGSKDRTAKWAILNRMVRATPSVQFFRKLHLPLTPLRLTLIFLFLCAHRRVIADLYR